MHSVQQVAEGPQPNPYYRLPAELRDLPQWCVAVGSATDKAPRSADGQPAKVNDPNTWMDFDTACRVASDKGWLIGFVFTENDPFAFIDLDWCDDPLFVASVRQFLRTRNIAGFNPGARAAMNEAKKAVVAASMTTEDENATALVENHPRDLITADDLFDAVFGISPMHTAGADTSRKWKLLAPIARKAGIEPMPKPFALFGRPKVKVWIVRNPQRWRAALVHAVEQELTRLPAPPEPPTAP